MIMKHFMEKYITDEHTGLRYELIGGIYYLADDDEAETKQEPIGIWGQRHLRFIKEHKHLLYLDLLMTDKLNSYLADINRQAEEMLLRLVEEMAKSEGVTEQLKAENQIEWVSKMNNIHYRATEFVYGDLIYS